MLERVFKFIAFIFICTISMSAIALELEIHVNGVDKELTKSIKADLQLQQAINEPKLTADRIHNLYKRAPDQITSTLQAKGFYSSQIDAKLDVVHGATLDQDKWIATFNINPGPTTKIVGISTEVFGPGKENPRINQQLNTPKLIPGHIIVHADYEDTKELLLANLHSLGYLQAEFNQSIIEINRSQNTANIKFIINTGPQYRFGKIIFIDCIYPYDFLIGFAPFKPGDPYELQKLIEFQSNLEAVDLFNKIRFDSLANLKNPQDTIVPINVRLSLKPKNRYTASIGYGTDTGARGSIGWLHRRRSTPGHKIYTGINASQKISTAKINYIIPGSHPATDKYVFGALGQIEKIEELLSRKAEIYANKTFKRGRLETMYGLWYFTETFRIIYGEPTLNTKYLLPTIKWIWIDSKETDAFEFGTRWDFKLRAGARCLFSDNSVALAEFNGKKIIPITEQMRGLFRVTAGVVTSREFDFLPPTLRFFAGGEESVRGYAYNSLGPLANPNDPDSNIGGRYLLILSAEVEQKLYKDFAGVIFFDAGNAALSTKIPLACGTGVGIRYKTPIGNFRLDVAKPLNIIINKHWRVHMNFGTDL